MSNVNSKFSKIVLTLLILLIAGLGVFFAIRENQTNIKTIKTPVEEQIEELNNTIGDLQLALNEKNAVLEQKNATISEQNEVIENQRATINSQSETIEDQLDTISDLQDDIDDLEDEIDTKDATISSQTSRINTLEAELSSEYNYQYTLDVNFYVDNNLYAYGKARNGGTLLLAPNDPSKTNYEFYGWSKSQNGSLVDLLTEVITSNTDLYAVFSDNLLDLENTIYLALGIAGDPATPLSNLITEQSFLEMIYSAISGNNANNMTLSELRDKINNNFDIENSNSMNFETYLKTLINRIQYHNDYYWIGFRVDNIFAYTIRADKTTGLLLRTPTAPTKENYTFDGWSRTANGTVISNLATEVFSGDTTLYAVFSAVQQQTPTFTGNDLTNTIWYFNPTLSFSIIGGTASDLNHIQINGNYNLFNSYFPVDFIYNGTELHYFRQALGNQNPFFQYSPDCVTAGSNDSGQRFTVYRESDGWLDESYRTITFTGGDVLTSSDFILWITQNATFVGNYTPQ